jgi:hypothetical protein
MVMGKPEKTGGVRVSRKDADEVFLATATEVLRKGKRPDSSQQSEGRKQAVEKKAEEIVQKAKKKGK